MGSSMVQYDNQVEYHQQNTVMCYDTCQESNNAFYSIYKGYGPLRLANTGSLQVQRFPKHEPRLCTLPCNSLVAVRRTL